MAAQCSGRAQTRVEVWQAQGTPSGNSRVTATLATKKNLKNAVIAVSRYSGAGGIGKITSANTVGVTGDCDPDRGKNIDTDFYSVSLSTSGPNSLLYAAVAIRHKKNTPGGGFTERAEVRRGSERDIGGLAIEDRVIGSPGLAPINGTLSDSIDWAVIGLEILPKVSSPPR